ncbi:MAG: PAS domain S-box protein, partial [Planctomycetota bacterium]
AVVVTDLQLNIIEVSQRALDLFNYNDTKEVIGRNGFDFFCPEEHERVITNIQKIFNEGFSKNQEVYFFRKDGARFLGKINSSLVRASGGKPKYIIAAIRDITERKESEQELAQYRKRLEELIKERTFEFSKIDEQLKNEIIDRKQTQELLKESEERFRAIFDNAIFGMILANPEDTSFYVGNKTICRILGYSLEELKQLKVKDIHPEEDLTYVMNIFKKQVRNELVIAEDMPVKRKNGSVFYAEIGTSLLTIRNKTYILGVFRDITEQKKAEEKVRDYQKQLRSLASELSLAEERERHRLARDLHDYTCQSLAIMKIKLDAFVKTASEEKQLGSLKDISMILEDTIERTRTLTFELSPPVLYELGLVSAIEWLAERFQHDYNIFFYVENTGKYKLFKIDIQITLFKIIRELMVNIVKHSRASKSRILIRQHKDLTQIAVEDNGVGFKAGVVERSKGKTGGFGLFSIRERIENIGGFMEVCSELGEGTIVFLSIPH